MRIEHIAMYVNDLENAKKFFVKYFKAKCGDMYHNVTTGFKSYFLSFENSTRLEIMTKDDLSECSNQTNRFGFIHLAFGVGSKENVDALTQQLSDDGYEILSEPRITGDGYYESCVKAVEGNLIEITI